jgi:L-fucose/D-arabinose isomerase
MLIYKLNQSPQISVITDYNKIAQTMKLSVFNGSLPKIGIRPTIDGRLGGVRESLEKQTMGLPGHVHDALDQRTNPTWPTTWFAPNLTQRGGGKSVSSGQLGGVRTADLEGADYRACQNFGPLYGKS